MLSRRPAPFWVPGLIALLLLFCSSAAAYQTERVVLVVIDGLRYSEGLGDPDHTYVPSMAGLAQEGAIVEPFQNDGYTYTSRAIPAIWCGAWTEIHTFSDPDCNYQENNYSELPTVFEYFRRQLGRPEQDCIYVLKDVGCPWKASFDQDYGPDYWPLYHSEGSTDSQVWDEAQEILTNYSPSFLMLYLAEVDHAGHSGDWNYYIDAIRTADAIVGDLWETLQEDPEYAGRTTMMVTNDHGRHTTDWTGHGCSCSGCRTIQLLAVGPDIESGLVSTVPRTLRDVTPTIGELLGFDAEQSTGSVMEEILETGSGIEEDPANRPPSSILNLAAQTSPFRPGTQISVHLPAPGWLRLTVHGADGSLKAVIHDGMSPDRAFRTAWDARDAARRPLEAGVYYLRLTSAGHAITKRVVLVK